MRWDVNELLWLDFAELDFQFSRSSGPGGQNVNKVNSKAQLRWNPGKNTSLLEPVRQRFLERYHSKLTKEGDILITSDAHRDQKRNQEDCLERLRQLILAVARPPKVRKPTKPTKGSKMRRLDYKKSRSDIKKNRGRVRD
jgi:ribosome-associated protein